MSKLSRQSVIRELIEAESLASQDELRRRLARHGFRVNQATLSRDLHEIGVVKTPEGYRLPENVEAAETAPPVERLIREFVREIREAQNLLVLKTTVGSAQPVAVAIDAEEWEEVVGTVAGDDTILVISPDKKAAGKLAARIREMLA